MATTVLMLSTPCYGGLCLQAYAESVMKLQKLCAQYGVQLMLDTTENESLVHRARNISVGRFMQKTEATHFFFVDADIRFEPESVLRLLASGHEVSCAVYPKKVIMWDQAAVAIQDNKDLPRASSSLVMNFKYSNTPITNGFAEVLDGPTGFLMIHRSVFEKMFKHYPELNCKNDHQNRDFDDYCAVFDCMIDPTNRRYLSEDYAFCRRWQMMGGQIFADLTTTLGHVGNLRFHGKLEDRLASNVCTSSS